MAIKFPWIMVLLRYYGTCGQQSEQCTDGVCQVSEKNSQPDLLTINISLPSDLVDKEKNIIYFTIEVKPGFNGALDSKVKRRYSEFQKLQEELKKFNLLPKTPFPGKGRKRDQLGQWVSRWFGSGSIGKEFVEKRRKGLEAWINDVKKTLFEADAVYILQHFLYDGLEEMAWIEEEHSKRGCECWIRNAKEGSIRDWLQLAVETNLDPCCINFGEHFGWWGQNACPHSLAEIVDHVRDSGAIEKKQGIDSKIYSEKYVIRKVQKAAASSVFSLLSQMVKKKLQMTLLTPVCRVLRVTHPSDDPEDPGMVEEHVVVFAHAALKTQSRFGLSHHRFDLKGNWGTSSRVGSDKQKMDADFNEMFPAGIEIQKMFPAEHSKTLAELIVQDSKMLAECFMFGYSISIDMVQVDESHIEGLLKDHEDTTPLVLGSSAGKKYVMVVGIVNFLMRRLGFEDQIAVLVTQMNQATCTPFDVDPLPPNYYRARFVRMVGYNDPGPGDHAQDAIVKDPIGNMLSVQRRCGACYYRGPKVKVKKVGGSATEFTYFPSEHQRQAHRKNDCEWAK